MSAPVDTSLMGRAWTPLRRRASRLAVCTLACVLLLPVAAATSPDVAQSAGWWHPRKGLSWQIQFSGTVDTSVRAAVYDIDMSEPTSLVRSLHSRGRRVVCYVSAGSFETWRPDASAFPSAVKGRRLDGWPDERWLDIRRLDLLRPIMAARFDRCRAKGFDAVDADNVDGYSNDTGFPLTGAHQFAYNRMLARLAHARGLAIGLKNDLEQVAALQPGFDFAVNEQCMQYRECTMLRPFLRAGKPVFHVEYRLRLGQFCPAARSLRFGSIRKRLALTAWRQAC